MELILSIVAIIASSGIFGFAIRINERLTRVETKNEILWKALEGRVGQMLKSPTHKRKDGLLDKLGSIPMTYSEILELKSILEDEISHNPPVDEGKKLAYALIIGRLAARLVDFKKRKV